MTAHKLNSESGCYQMKVRPPELESDAIPKPEIRVNTLRLTLRNSLEKPHLGFLPDASSQR